MDTTRTGPLLSATPRVSTSSTESPTNRWGTPPYPRPLSSSHPPVYPSPSPAQVSVSLPDGEDTRNYASVSEPVGQRPRGDLRTTILRSFAGLCRSVSLCELVLTRCVHVLEQCRHAPVSGGSFSKMTFWDPTTLSPPTALNIDRSSFVFPPCDDSVRCGCPAREG